MSDKEHWPDCKPPFCTREHRGSSVGLAQRRGWVVGTLLEGTCAREGTHTIRITALGISNMLGVCLTCNGQESLWNLTLKCWRRVLT